MVCNTNCAGCPFGGSRVRSRGNPDSDLVIIGEAPGAQEVVKGFPFVGPSGKLLWDTFSKVGFEDAEETAFITNALRCRPPTGPIPNGAIDACHGRLIQEVSHRPRLLIIALGNTANRSLFGDRNFKITQQRGSIREWTDATGNTVLVLPVLHPAAILRNPGDYVKFKSDLAYATEVYKGTGTRKHPGETRYTLVRDDQLPRAIQALSSCDTLALDIETSGFNPRTDHILALGIAWKKNTVLVFTGEQIPSLAPLFSNPGIRFVWHNGKFDTSFLQTSSLPARVDEDTMLLHYALDENRGGHGLKDLAADYLGAGDYDAILKKYLRRKSDTFEVIPRPVLHKYLAQDCDYTLQLYDILRPKVAKDPDLEKLYTRTLLPASAFLQRVERNGMHVDIEGLERLGASLIAIHDQIEAEMLELSTPYWNPIAYMETTGSHTASEKLSVTSPAQLTWLIYNSMFLRPVDARKTKGMKLSTRKEMLAELPQTPFIKALRLLRKIDKAYSTYVKGVKAEIEDDGRVHSTYFIHSTVTGRLSSRGPNLQNVPRDATIRRIFAAPEGRVLVDADFASHELRCLAHYSGDQRLIRIFEDGIDLHDDVTEAMFEIKEAEVDKLTWNEARIRAKAVNFGIAYGRGPGSLAQEYGMELEDAQEIIRRWFERFPMAAKFLHACRNAPLQGHILRTPFGRKRRFGMVARENLHTVQNEASNFPISSLASDLTLHAAIRMEPRLGAIGRSTSSIPPKIVNLVHDSIVVECNDDPELVREVIDTMLSTMVETPQALINARLTFGADAKVGRKWGQLIKWKGELTQEMLSFEDAAIEGSDIWKAISQIGEEDTDAGDVGAEIPVYGE